MLKYLTQNKNLYLIILNYSLILSPLVILIFLILRYKIDVPYCDQWAFLPYIEKMYQGNLSFNELWGSFNGHRILFPGIIMLTLGYLTKWDMLFELLVNILLACCIFLLIAQQIKITLNTLNISGINLLMPIISLIIFSLAQYQNWLWGWQIQIFLNLSAVVFGIILLSNPPLKWYKFVTAILMGIIASFSFANGLLYWFIGIYILLANPLNKPRLKFIYTSSWGIISAAIIFIYFYKYQLSSNTLSLQFTPLFMLEYCKYSLNYLGGYWELAGY